MSDTRRFTLCLIASLLINSASAVLVGHIWRSQTSPVVVPGPHLKMVRLALRPVPRPVVREQPIHRPPPKITTHPRPPHPKKRLRPGARVRSSQPAPLAKPAGGSDAGAPRMAAVPVAAPAPRVLTSPRHSVLVAHNTPAPPSLSPAANVPAGPPSPTPATTPVVTSGSGAGGAAAGKGTGSGEGTGTGPGIGAGTSRDAGEPFGVGKGLAGDGGPRHVVYVLDISGSMTSRIDRAEAELRGALDSLQPGETFNIIAFSDRAQPFDTGMASVSPSMIRQAANFLTTLQVDGGTNLEGAMTRALSLPDVNEVVVLTDGVPTIGETNFKKLARLIRERNRNHARISTVGLVGKNPDGTDDSFEATHLLQQIADESGGASKLVSLGVATP